MTDHLDLDRLRALVDAILPEDDDPSASSAGALRYLARAFERDQPVERLRALLDRIDPQLEPTAALKALGDDEDLRWLAGLVSAGYYADATNGGNDGSASWRMVGWRPGPEGWPGAFLHEEDRTGLVGFDELETHYDVVVIGSGAGGGAAASVFADAGRRVLMIEAGDWPDDAQLVGDHLRNPRATYGFTPFSGPAGDGNPRSSWPAPSRSCSARGTGVGATTPP